MNSVVSFSSPLLEVIRYDPFHLNFLLWIALCEEGTSFIVLCIQQLFPQLKTNTNKLSSRCDVDTLCLFDIEVSLVFSSLKLFVKIFSMESM